MNNNIYTNMHWKKDKEFNALPGQQVDEAVYNQMLNCIQPKDLPGFTARKARMEQDIPIHFGFLMGEPHSTDEEGNPLYLAFGGNDFSSKGARFYYLGLSKELPVLSGSYYVFDCLNSAISDRLWEASAFKDDKDAIKTAADYEAVLTKREYKNNKLISSEVLYEPAFL